MTVPLHAVLYVLLPVHSWCHCVQMWQGWAKRLLSLAPAVINAACAAAERPEGSCIKALQLRLRIWGSGEVTDGTRRALLSMVDVWRPRKGKLESVVSLRAVEWLSMLQRLAVCVIQDDDAVIPDATMRRVRRWFRVLEPCACACRR